MNKERGTQNSKMGKLVIISLILLLGCDYKTDPLNEGTYKSCIDASGCHSAVGACIMNDGVARGRTLQDQAQIGFPSYCVIQSQLCKKRCLQCAANSGGSRSDYTNCKFLEFRFLYLDSEGLY